MKDLTRVIGLARHVMRALGKGHRESVYGKALQVSLMNASIAHRSEVCCPIIFQNVIVGHGRADFVFDEFVIEIKALRGVPDGGSDQLQKYIKSLNNIERRTYRGILFNFNQSSGKLDVYVHETRPVKTTSRFFKHRPH